MDCHRRNFIAAVVCATAFISCTKSVPSTRAEKAAVEAAHAWLQLVDGAMYSQSWSAAATMFRSAVPNATWATQIHTVRQPLGPVASRTLSSVKYTTALPGAPDGEYVVLEFETSFANKKDAIEIVTPMRDRDSLWRVSGYYIK
jgi:hypothetical protein